MERRIKILERCIIALLILSLGFVVLEVAQYKAMERMEQSIIHLEEK